MFLRKNIMDRDGRNMDIDVAIRDKDELTILACLDKYKKEYDEKQWNRFLQQCIVSCVAHFHYSLIHLFSVHNPRNLYASIKALYRLQAHETIGNILKNLPTDVDTLVFAYGCELEYDVDPEKSVVVDYMFSSYFDPFCDNGYLFSGLRARIPELYKVLMKLPKVLERLRYINTEDDVPTVGIEETLVLYPVIVKNPLWLIRKGFFPTPYQPSKAFTDYVNGIDMETLCFWANTEDKDYILDLKNCTRWCHPSLSSCKEQAIHSADSLALSILAPHLLYEKSKRPITDMSLFRGENYISRSLLTKVDEWTYTVTLNGKTYIAVPVTRYSTGMSRGLFFGPSDNKYKGTFYYYEPESSTFLLYEKGEIYFNKLSAIESLDTERVYSKEIDELRSASFPEIADYTDGKISEDLMLTPQEVCDASWVKLYRNTMQVYNDEYISKISQNKHYGAHFLCIHAAEDKLDQPLCDLSEEKGLDVLIFTHEPGSHQVVGEVLDVRDRETSFSNLVYVVD